MKQKLGRNSFTILVLGDIAIGLSAFYLISYNVRRFMFGAPEEQGSLIAIVALAMLGLTAVIVSRCLKALEVKVSPNLPKEPGE